MPCFRSNLVERPEGPPYLSPVLMWGLVLRVLDSWAGPESLLSDESGIVFDEVTERLELFWRRLPGDSIWNPPYVCSWKHQRSYWARV